MEYKMDSPLTYGREDYFGTGVQPPFFEEVPVMQMEANSLDNITAKNAFNYAEIPECVFKNYLKVSQIEDKQEFPDEYTDKEGEIPEGSWYELPMPEMQ